jgi:cellobiose phosphorylase
MRFGHFDDARREYVVTTPHTPYPWLNYLGCEDFFSLISHQAAGYCFYRDARLRRLTRYRYNNVPTDAGGRYLYVRDGDDFWSPSYMPVKAPLDFFECRHGLGYTRITGERRGVRVGTTFVVPLGHTAEVHCVEVTNTSQETKTLKLFSYVEFCLWNAYDDMTNFQRNLSTGEVEVDGSTIYHKTEYRERRNHFSFYSVNAPVVGFDTDRERFMGLYNGMHEPRAVSAGSSGNSIASGWAPIASHCIEVALAPNEEKTFVFVLGYVENPPSEKWERPGVVNKVRARRLIERFSTAERVETALGEIGEYWSRLLSTFQFGLERRTPQPDGQHLEPVPVHGHVQHFPLGVVLRERHRSRNGLSRLEPGFARFRPSRAGAGARAHRRHRIDAVARRERLPPVSAAHEARKQRDRQRLQRRPSLAHLRRRRLRQGDGGLRRPEGASPVRQRAGGRGAALRAPQARLSSRALANLGPHGLPLIGRADWNDCLNLNCFSETPDESFQTTGNRSGRTAESVFIAGMFVGVAAGLRLPRDPVSSTRPRAPADTPRRCAKRSCATVGTASGSSVLTIFSGKRWAAETAGGPDLHRAAGLLRHGRHRQGHRPCEEGARLHQRALDTKYGVVLNQPAYTSYHVELGEISSYPPGYKENAGIFCHNNPWIMIAETVIGRGDRAFDYYKKIAPAYLEERSARFTASSPTYTPR